MQPRLMALAGLPLALMLTACSGTSPEPDPAPPASNAVPVTAGIARIETLRDALVLPGLVVPSSLGDWTVTAPGPATVAELPVMAGEAVAVGDLLVRFEVLSVAEDARTRQSALTLAEQTETAAATELARLEELFSRGLVPRNDVEAARAAASAASASAGQARTEMALIQKMQEAHRITARFAGLVTTVSKVAGDYVDGTTNDPVLRVVDPTQTQVAVDVPVEQVTRITIGHAATITGPLSPEPFTATVARVDLPADPTVTTASVRLQYVAAEPLAMDTPVRVDILLDERPDAVVVPADAVLRDEDGPYVLLAGADLIAHRRAVRLGIEVNGLVQVLQGLDAGERIIVSSTGQVVDGQAILVSR